MIEIKKNYTLETTWAILKNDIKTGPNPLNVGDEIDIVLKTGENVTLVCERAGHRSATFFTKNLLEDTHCMNENWIAKNGEQLSPMEAYLGKLFRLLPDELQEVATEPLRLLREKEIFGENEYGKEETCEPLPRYFKEENRVKTLNGVQFPYWLATPHASYSNVFCSVYRDGSSNNTGASRSYGVCFGFDI
ncbi:MAG: hypothetical protein KH138_07190 [Firmicutes bacterium]|nr:hypothetical protein [Bacillota bacterium]